MRLDAHRRPVRGAHVPLHRRAQQYGNHGARGLDLQDRRGPDLLLQAARSRRGGRDQHDRERLLQGSLQRAAHGVRRRGAAAARHQPRGERRMTGTVLLEIKNLHAGIDGNEILRGVDLTVRAGEVHAIMGPNGSGKSTLAQVLAGNPAYTITTGSAQYLGKDLAALKPEERARDGLFIDALKTVAHTVDKLRRPDSATVLVTHYYRILTHIVPDYVHVLSGGRIVKSGGKDLALELEEKGYDWVRDEAPVA